MKPTPRKREELAIQYDWLWKETGIFYDQIHRHKNGTVEYHQAYLAYLYKMLQYEKATLSNTEHTDQEIAKTQAKIAQLQAPGQKCS